MGVKLKNAILLLLDNLAPTAFVGAKPTEETLGLQAVRYNVVLSLGTGTVISNQAAYALEGSTYTALISVAEGYKLTNVVVTHDGSAVQTSIVNNQCQIQITNVQGIISISTTAIEVVTHQIVTSLVGCNLSNSSAVPDGDTFSAILSADDNYTLDGAQVEVSMGGSPVSGAYNSATHQISVANVTDDITINAAAVPTYITDGLDFWLDGIDHGDTDHPNAPESWIDLIHGVDFPNHGATYNSEGKFWSVPDGNYLGYSDSSKKTIYHPEDVTIEVVFYNTTASGGLIHLAPRSAGVDDANNSINIQTGYKIWGSYTPYNGDNGIWTGTGLSTANSIKLMSINSERCIINGVSQSAKQAYTYMTHTGGRRIGKRVGETGTVGTVRYYSVRIYTRKLSQAEILHNQRVDNQRFNLGLNI